MYLLNFVWFGSLFWLNQALLSLYLDLISVALNLMFDYVFLLVTFVTLAL